MKVKKDYNKELVKRGELLIDPSLFQEEQKQKKNPKGGRPHLYPRNHILFLMFLKFALRLPYRQTEGIARKLLSFLRVKVPNFRTLHYRFTKEEINLQDLPQVRDLPQDFVIVLDSTGLKVTNRGEWIRKKHRKRPRKGWVKLHVALDMNSWQVINIEVTNEKVHDSQKAIQLLEGVSVVGESRGLKVKKLIADSGYDTHALFRYMHANGIEPCVKVRSNAEVSGNTLRDRVVRAYKKGKRAWKRANGYGKRWFVESYFSVFKRWFGEYVSSVRFENIRSEVVFKVWILNLFLGMMN